MNAYFQVFDISCVQHPFLYCRAFTRTVWPCPSLREWPSRELPKTSFSLSVAFLCLSPLRTILTPSRPHHLPSNPCFTRLCPTSRQQLPGCSCCPPGRSSLSLQNGYLALVEVVTAAGCWNNSFSASLCSSLDKQFMGTCGAILLLLCQVNCLPCKAFAFQTVSVFN